MKKLLVLLIATSIVATAFGQGGYNDQLDPIDGVNISYKIIHDVASDETTPAELRLKFKNTNDYAVNISFQIGYSEGMTSSSESEVIVICIPKMASRMGKIHGLNFSVSQEFAKYMTTDKDNWEFISFDVEEIDKCENSGANKD